MTDVNNTLKCHLFVCTNTRKDGKASCGEKGAEFLRSKIKEATKQEFGKSVRINAAGCLGECEKGVVCVLYPQGQWFFGQNQESSLNLIREVQKAVKGTAL